MRWTMTLNKVIKLFGVELNFYIHTDSIIPIFKLIIFDEPFYGRILFELTIIGFTIGVVSA